MSAGAGIAQRAGRRGSVGAWALLLIAVALSLSVLLINRTPLYYFDSAGYYKQGSAAIKILMPKATKRAVKGGNFGTAIEVEEDDTTIGSRSMLYAVLVAASWRLKALVAVPLLSLGLVLLAACLPAWAAARYLEDPPPTPTLVAVPMIAAAAGSMPFYIAYIMPDILAPILLLVIAVLTAMSRDLGRGALLLAMVLGVLAVVVHPSHLAIAGLMVPLVLLASPIVSRHRWWLPPLMVLLLFLAGVAERQLFRFAAKTVADKEVIYVPHITARLIVDGPGLAYLEEHCPDPEIATCKLYEALSWSDDPYRLTVSHIIFSKSHRLGSFRLMEVEDQRRVALGQKRFFLAVLKERPFHVLYAFGRNTLHQILRYSIDQTIPNDAILRLVRDQTGFNKLDGGPLAGEDRAWIDRVDAVHGVVYALAFAMIVVLLLWPGRVPPKVKMFAVMVLLGILVNAFVCGAVSQPADRYGARVMWLLPFVAAFMALCFAASGRRDSDGTA